LQSGITNRLSKNPEEYENENGRKRKIGLAVGARKGDVVEYFETDNNKEGYSLKYGLCVYDKNNNPILFIR
jgi:hypothetical protein